jgi:hypothetical protein
LVDRIRTGVAASTRLRHSTRTMYHAPRRDDNPFAILPSCHRPLPVTPCPPPSPVTSHEGACHRLRRQSCRGGLLVSWRLAPPGLCGCHRLRR